MRALLLSSVSVAALLSVSVEKAATEEIVLDRITISATREDEAPIEALSSTSVVTRDELDRIQPTTPADILFGLPGVTTTESSGAGIGSDPVASSVNIRGLQDFGRVNVTIDGARQNFQRSGHNADGSFYIEPDLVEQVTVIRGPVSNVYGSGAIGGVVAFETIDPLDFLLPGERFAVSAKAQYDTNADGRLFSTTAATQAGERIGVLGNIVFRDRDDYQDGDGNTILNSGSDVVAGLGKIQILPADGMEIDLGYVGNRSEFVSGATGFQRDTEITDDTLTGTFSWDAPNSELIDLHASSYWTRTDTEQLRLDGSLRGNRRTFNIDTVGFDIFNTSRFSMGSMENAFTFGIDAFRDEVETNDPLGAGDQFTPSGERTVYGGFIQHQIEPTSWLEVIGALRFDAYELEGGDVEGEGDRVSPKLTVGVSPFEQTAFHGFQIYATYAEGYRAPAVTETLVQGFHPPPFQFEFIPNPDLEPEVAKTYEIGFNLARDAILTENDALRVKGAYFHNDVENFINGVFTPTPFPGFFTYENVANAEINGFEIEGIYDANWVFVSLAAHRIRGDNVNTDQPLTTIPPDKVVTTLGFRAFDQRLTFGGRWFAVAEQDRVPAGSPTSDAFDVVNLFAEYEHNDNLSFGAAVDNVFDQQYTRFLDASPNEGLTARLWIRGRFGT